MLLACAARGQDPDLLEPEKAFRFSARLLEAGKVEVRYEIARGYYMYRDKFKFSAEPASITVDASKLPAGQIKKDEFFGNVQSDGSENGVPMIKEGVERSPEPVVIHLLDRDAEVDIRSGFFGPFRNVGHRHRRVESGGKHETEDRPMIKLSLLIGGDVLVDDLFEFDSFEHGRDHGQLSKITTLNILGFPMASKSIHALSLAV